MALREADLAKLAADVEEARQLLQRKAKVEQEIQAAEKRQRALDADIVTKQRVLEQLNATATQVQQRHEYEKARLAADLRDHQAQCDAQKRAAEAKCADDVRVLHASFAATRDRLDAARSGLENEVATLRTRLAGYHKEVQDFRARVALLG